MTRQLLPDINALHAEKGNKTMTKRKPGRLSKRGKAIIYALLALSFLLICISGYRIFDLYIAFH